MDDEEALVSEPDIETDRTAQTTRTWLVEQCLAWGGEQRLRLRLTVAVSPGQPHTSPSDLRASVAGVLLALQHTHLAVITP